MKISKLIEHLNLTGSKSSKSIIDKFSKNMNDRDLKLLGEKLAYTFSKEYMENVFGFYKDISIDDDFISTYKNFTYLKLMEIRGRVYPAILTEGFEDAINNIIDDFREHGPQKTYNKILKKLSANPSRFSSKR